VPAPYSSELQLPRLRPAPDGEARGAAEQRLARALLRGQPGMAAELWDHFAPLVRGILVRSLGPDRSVEESMQAILLRVLRRRRLGRDSTVLRAGVASIAFDYVRRQMRRRPAAAGDLALDMAPGAGASRALRALYTALDALPTGQRIAFTLRFLESLPPSEAAALARVSTATLARDLTAAKQRLWSLLADGGAGEDAPFEALGRIVRAAASVEPDLPWAAAARARFALRAEARRMVRWRPWAQAALVGALGLAAALAVTMALRPGGKLRYELLPATTEAPHTHAAPLLRGGTALRFPDGTELALESDGSGRLVETSSTGGRFVLEDGTLWTSVAAAEGARWTVEAGAFAVRLPAGAFRARFAEQEGRLEIELVSGSATVEGPRFVQRLVAGQHLAATAAGIVSLGAPPAARVSSPAPRGR
jgi:RNA polymerase sigma-70 factor (ECF subfamily)